MAAVPKGGAGPDTYTYQWVDSSSTQNFWDDIPGATSKDYDPGPLADTTYFRRIVSSGALPADTSFRIAVYVHPAITNNTIAAPDTVCSGLAPELFESSQVAGGPPWIGGGPTGGTFRFKWQEMEEGSGVFSDLTGITEDSTYQAGGLTTSTDYRRIAYAGVCVDTSNELNVRVLQPIAGNDVTPISEATPFDTICFNTAPEQIDGPVPTGGETTDIRYQWLTSDNPLVMGSLVPGETGRSFQSSATEPDHLLPKDSPLGQRRCLQGYQCLGRSIEHPLYHCRDQCNFSRSDGLPGDRSSLPRRQHSCRSLHWQLPFHLAFKHRFSKLESGPRRSCGRKRL